MENRKTRLPRASGGAAGWDRDAVTYRLTPTRKSRLLALVGDDQGSPTDALDAAIERATAASMDEGQEQSDAEVTKALADLRDQIHALAVAAQAWGGVQEKLELVAVDCAELRHAISSAAALADGVALDIGEPVAAWLGRADPALAWIVCKLRWLGKRSAGSGMALWDVELRELGRAGALRARESDAFRIALGPALATGPLARLESMQAAVLCCARSDRGWTLSLRSALEDGKLGEPFAELSI